MSYKLTIKFPDDADPDAVQTAVDHLLLQIIGTEFTVADEEHRFGGAVIVLADAE